MSFKLLAIRPMPGTDSKFLKNLKPGVIYKFYQEYEYLNSQDKDLSKWTYQSGGNGKNYLVNPDDSNEKIELTPDNPLLNVEVKKSPATTVPEDLYSIPGGPTINISAIVGKNGSGKSSLLELLFKQIYNLSVKRDKPLIDLKAIKKEKEKEIRKNIRKQLKENREIRKILVNSTKGTVKSDKESIEDIIMERQDLEELGREVAKTDFLIQELDSMDLSNIQVFFALKQTNAKEETIKILEREKLDSDFYSIVLNYSTYSLNSNVVGFWIDKLFHKNDGYLTPIVLNPMRTDGDVDVNNENHLNKSRLLLNLNLLPVFDKKVQEIAFEVSLGSLKPDKKKNKTILDNSYSDIVFKVEGKTFCGYRLDNNGRMDNGQERDDINELDTIGYLSRELRVKRNFIDLVLFNPSKINGFKNENDLDDEAEKELIKFYLFKYLLNKIMKYAKIIKLRSDTDSFIRIKDLQMVLNQIKKDSSHQTFKIYQILHLLQEKNFEKFYNLVTKQTVNFEKIFLTITKENFDLYLNEFTHLKYLSEENKLQIYKAPAAFFGFEFQFENESIFSSLSSGEQQLINSINTIAYHLRNIDSKNGSYKKINVIFDEVELYFHVDYQRQYISKLIEAIKLLELKEIQHLNILFSTHSPFILSDIPSQNILRLEDGGPVSDDSKTFGSSIHKLLKNQFFLEKGFQGEFATGEIRKVYLELQFLKVSKNPEGIKESIRESILKEYQDAFKCDLQSLDLKNNQNKYGQLIQLVGEPILRNELEALYHSIFEDEGSKIREVKRLMEKLKIDKNQLQKYAESK